MWNVALTRCQLALQLNRRIFPYRCTEIIELHRNVALKCVNDSRLFSVRNWEEFELLAQNFVETRAKYGSVDAKALFDDPTTIWRRVLPKLTKKACVELSVNF